MWACGVRRASAPGFVLEKFTRRSAPAWSCVLLVLGACGGTAKEDPLPEEGCPTRPDDLVGEDAANFSCGGNCETSSCSSGPCQPEPFLEATPTPVVLTIDTEHLFWGSNDHVIRRHALAGGSTEEVAIIEGYPRGLARQGSRLFWTSSTEVYGPKGQDVASMSLPDGPVLVLASYGTPRQIAVTAEHAYWADFSVGVRAIRHVDGAPMETADLFGGWTNAAGVWVFGSSVFWTQINLDNSIWTRGVEDTATPVRLACNQQWPSSIVADQDYAYWINRHIYEDTGRLMRLALSGGHPTVLVADLQKPTQGSLVGDATTLYWVENGNSIMRLQK